MSIIDKLNEFLDVTLESMNHLEEYRDTLYERHITDMSVRYAKAYNWLVDMRNALRKADINNQLCVGSRYVICRSWCHVSGKCVSYLIPSNYEQNFNTAPVDGGHEILDSIIRDYEDLKRRAMIETDFAEQVVMILKVRAHNINADIKKYGGDVE